MTATASPKAALAKPSDKSGKSLFGLAVDSQEIDGELAIAINLASSDDPEEAAKGEELTRSILERANANQEQLREKLNQMAFAVNAFSKRAAALKEEAKACKEKADADAATSERILRSMARTMRILHPGQDTFHLDRYDLTSMQSDSTSIEDQEQVPARFCRHEITISVPSGWGNLGPSIFTDVCEFVADWGDQIRERAPQFTAGISTAMTSTPDKALIKQAILADPGQRCTETKLPVAQGAATDGLTLSAGAIPGATVIRKRSWRLR